MKNQQQSRLERTLSKLHDNLKANGLSSSSFVLCGHIALVVHQLNDLGDPSKFEFDLLVDNEKDFTAIKQLGVFTDEFKVVPSPDENSMVFLMTVTKEKEPVKIKVSYEKECRYPRISFWVRKRCPEKSVLVPITFGLQDINSAKSYIAKSKEAAQ